MNKLISRLSLSVLALLFSSAGFAATVTLEARDAITNTLLTNTDLSGDGSLDVLVGQAFYLTVFGAGFPAGTATTGTVGATLKLTFSSAVSVVTPSANGIVLAPSSQFTGGVTLVNDPFLSGNQFAVNGPPTGANPGGNFGGFGVVQFNFNSIAAGNANIVLVDDQVDNCWTDASNFGCVPATYTQALVTVHAVPVPAAAWLFGSALGLLGVARRRSA